MKSASSMTTMSILAVTHGLYGVKASISSLR